MDYGGEEIEDTHPPSCPLCEVYELDPYGRHSISGQLGAGIRALRGSTVPASPSGDMKLGAQEMRNTEQSKAADLSTWRLGR
jgi:hypothetical protein